LLRLLVPLLLRGVRRSAGVALRLLRLRAFLRFLFAALRLVAQRFLLLPRLVLSALLLLLPRLLFLLQRVVLLLLVLLLLLLCLIALVLLLLWVLLRIEQLRAIVLALGDVRLRIIAGVARLQPVFQLHAGRQRERLAVRRLHRLQVHEILVRQRR